MDLARPVLSVPSRTARALLWLLALVPTVAAVGCAGPPAIPTPQRPTFASSTQTTAPGTMEIVAGISVDPGDRNSVPMTAKLGVTENSEIFVSWAPYNWVDRSAAQGNAEGIGDVEIGMRERVLDFGPNEPAIAYQFKTKLPTASARQEIGTEEMDFFAAAMLEMPYGSATLLGFYQLGFLGDPTGGDPDIQHGLSVSGSIPVAESFGAFGEIAGIITPELDDEQLIATGGVTYPIMDGWLFDAAVAVGLSNDAPDLQFLVGVTVNLGGIGTD